MNVVLLDSQYDLRRYPFAHEVAPNLLPIVETPLLGRTVAWLRQAGAREIALVSPRNPADDFELARAVVDYQLRPVASLGEALDRSRRQLRLDELLLVMEPNLHRLPDFSELLERHMIGRNALTYVRGTHVDGPGRYTFGSPVLALASPVVSRMMRFDDRPRPLEHMLQTVRARGLGVGSVEPDRRVTVIDNSYALYHANLHMLTPQFLQRSANDHGLTQRSENLWVGRSARLGQISVDPRGGAVVIGRGAGVGDGSILRGPTIVGRGANIESGSCLHRSLVLVGSQIPRESWVSRSIISKRLRQRVVA